MSMKITLSEDAKRQIIFKACIDAKKKFLPDAIVDWKDDKYKVEINCCSQLHSTKKVGFFRRKIIIQDHTSEINCVEVIIFRTEFDDLRWGEIRVKSLNRDFDNLAEEIAHTIEQYTPVLLIINDPSKVTSLNNPSRR